jgi:hypothetical protein
MIRYSLRCSHDHRFDSWFGSSGDFDRLLAGGMVTCAVCGAGGVSKDLMAPTIKTGRSARSAGEKPGAAPSLSQPLSPAEQALSEFRRAVEASSENVGRDFASEARRIHEGAAPRRSIIGEANPSEARGLIEDGIPVAPLPWGKSGAN